MSLAINREEINDTLYFGKAMIIQSTISPECTFYKEEWGKAYVEYDPDQANALLDEMGLAWDAAKQWRLRSDGKPLGIVLQYNQEFPGAAYELVREYWEAVGMQVEIRAIERSLYSTRDDANELDLGVWHSDRIEEIRCYMPRSTKFEPDSMGYANEWAAWRNSDGAEGEEPPQEWQDQFALMDEWYTAATDEAYHDLAQQVWQFFSDQLVLIGTVGYPPQPALIKNGLKNVPEFAYRGDGANHLKTAWPQIWWWDL
jgi:peptide/nickel transport system substrate-binding protein